MFKTVIWATDGSPAADQAMPYVRSLALENSAEVMVLHVDQFLVGRGGGQPLIANEDEMAHKIGQQARELREDGIAAAERVIHVAVGEGPAQTIAAAAKELGADLIVVGTRGHTSLGGLLVGSVTTRLLHLAPCPVFVVPSGSGTVRVPEPHGAEHATA